MPARGRSSTTLAVGQGFLGFGLILIGVAATLATLLGFFGSTWWLFDVAANYRAHLAVILVIVAISYAVLFSRATGVFFLVMALINIATIVPLYTGSQPTATGDVGYKIVSFNVAQRSSIRESTYRWLRAENPDLIVLLESNQSWEAAAVELLRPYSIQSQLPIDRTYGITILAKSSLETQLLQAAEVRDSVVRIEAVIDEQPLVIYAVQTRSPNNESNSAYRDQYLVELARMVNQESLPTVVVGDLNATPWSYAFRELTGTTGLHNSMVGFGLQTTWPATRWAPLRIPFDHLLYGDGLTTVDRALGPMFGVDHRPIVVTIGIADG